MKLIVFVCFFSSSFLLPSFLRVDFNEAVSRRQKNLVKYALPLSYNMYKKLYEKNLPLKKMTKGFVTSGSIEKIIHIIWLGSKLPDKYNVFVDSWRKNHESWEVILWDDSRVENFDIKNKKLYNSANNFGIKSDLLRLEILYQYGGVYVDTDLFSIKPLDDLIGLDLFVGLEYESNLLINNAIIGSCKRNPIIGKMLDELHKFSCEEIKNIPMNKVIAVAGPVFLSNFFSDSRFNKMFYDQKAIIFPPTYFCSFPFEKRMDFIEGKITLDSIVEKYCFKESLAVHLWDGSWSV